MRFISPKTHTIIGLVVGVILIFAPQIFDFSNDQSAASVAIGTGIFIILSELITTSQISPLKIIPMRIHLILDYITGVFLALSPWLFGFAENVWAPHLIMGILTVGYAAFTNPTIDVEKPTAV